jgi:hypothetical protein
MIHPIQELPGQTLRPWHASDRIRFMTIMGAIFPDTVREAIKDQMAEIGMTDEDLRELIHKLESPAPDQ